MIGVSGMHNVNNSSLDLNFKDGRVGTQRYIHDPCKMCARLEQCLIVEYAYYSILIGI
jgi:hypothetical protein